MPGTLRSLKGSVARSGRGLERARKEMEELVAQWRASEDPADLVDETKAARATLEQQWARFDGELKEFVQMVAEEDDTTYDADQTTWEGLEYESRRLLNTVAQLLEKVQPAAPTGAAADAGADDQQQNQFVENVNRLVLAMENQQAHAANGGGHVPDPGHQDQLAATVNRLVMAMEQSQQDRAGNHAPGQSGTNGPTSSGEVLARLPKLELPKFKGDPLEWCTFWDRFDNSVGKNTRLAGADKLNYLLGQLEGDPKKMIKPLPLTNDNYAVGVKMLKDRYQDTKLIISLLYRKLTDIKVVKNESSALKRFLAEVDCVLESLKAMGQDADDTNFVSVILSKLPTGVVTILEMFKDVDDPWTVPLLRKKLADHVIKMDRAEKASANGTVEDGDSDFTADGLLGSENKGRKKGQPPKPKPGGKDKKKSGAKKQLCAFCNGDHWSDRCKKFQTSDDRYQKAMELKLCPKCLRSGHDKKDCTYETPCYFCKRVKSHHGALCFGQFGKKKKGKEDAGVAADDGQSDANDKQDGDSDSGEEGMLAAGEQVTLQTALITVSASFDNGSTKVQTRVLFDPGACRSYCSDHLAKKLGLKLGKGPSLTVNRFGGKEPIQVSTKKARLQVRSLDGTISEITIAVIPQITGEVTRKPVRSQRLEKLSKRLNLADKLPKKYESAPIDLLLGSDHYLDYITGEKIEVEKGLYLLGSEFGYILTGRSNAHQDKGYSLGMCGFTNETLAGLNDLVAQPSAEAKYVKEPEISEFWSLEGIGIKDKVEDAEDENAIECFEKGVEYNEGRYSVPLPWNENAQHLKSDFHLSLGRLSSLLRRLKENKDLFKTYDETIRDQLQKGVIEKVDMKERPGPIIHYIPHHAVVDPQKETTKVRVVYDGSAKTKSEHSSLNEALYRGPVILDDLVGHLLRFRLQKIAIISDIEKAFLQIDIHEKDRHALRFLWLKDPTNLSVEDNIEIYRFRRVLFGLNCSPALLGLTIQHHLRKVDTAVAKQVLDGLYVDNVIAGAETAGEAKRYYKAVKAMFKDASMNMRQWASNCAEFNESVPLEDRIKYKDTKVLGMYWDRQEDVISINAGQHSEPPKTKRQASSAVSKVFDPLGLMAPVTVRGKILLQEISLSKKSWDAELDEALATEWSEYLGRLEEIPQAKIPRRTEAEGRNTLIAFCDASTNCYATAVYLRSETSSKVETNLLLSKGRLNPSRQLSVPKQELMAILIGIRALKFAKEQTKLKVDKTLLFSDSKCALFWVKNGNPPGFFCKNRVKEITSKGKETTFRYVQTDENPADWATRGMKVSEITSFWWNGPKWLAKRKKDWPDWEFDEFLPTEAKPVKKVVFEASLPSQTQETSPFPLDEANYSSLTKLHRVTAWCLRFIDRLRKQPTEGNNCLTVKELKRAKLKWELHVQKRNFGPIIQAVEKNRRHPMMRMGLFIDQDGLLRCKGRMSNAPLVWRERFPKLMPAKDTYSELLVQSFHKAQGHTGAAQTLNSLRREYWIPRGRGLVMKLVHRCAICRKAVGKPYATPPMPELPSDRVTPHPTFEICGVDYFGPLKVRDDQETKKTWICLFTCLSTRAIHLELVHDMTSVEFLLALRRFIARRGQPKKMISDNGLQFKLVSQMANKVWTSVLRHDDVINFCTNGGIDWNFITDYAPFMGGVYERLVGVVKECLRKTIGKAMLTSQQLQTLLCECEAIVNCRPLTYVGSDDSITVLTPAHFLNPIQAVVSPEADFDEVDFAQYGSTAQELIRNWKKGQNLIDAFWKVWLTDYLNMLRERSKYQHAHSSRLALQPKVGHLVLVKEPNLPRGSWRMGLLTELHESADMRIRSVTVQLPSGRKIKRPVGLLVPFETEFTDQEPDPGPAQ